MAGILAKPGVARMSTDFFEIRDQPENADLFANSKR